jgi:hypothetical protein
MEADIRDSAVHLLEGRSSSIHDDSIYLIFHPFKSSRVESLVCWSAKSKGGGRGCIDEAMEMVFVWCQWGQFIISTDFHG